ncbi:12208_t:CDS:10 [Entrophospora sp. SA101]|nr:12208_t:CDS:10 [Entrophospora sp. SA101]
MSSIPSNQIIFEWCADLKKLDLYLNSINQSQSKEGVILLKTLLKKDDFPKNITCESIDDCFFFSLSTHQFQLVQAACKVILKTQLSLQIIESNTPINVQPVLFRSLLSYGRDFFGNDPQNNPIILYHRWIIRSSSNNIEFEINLDQNKKSAELLNELYVKMTEQLMSNSTTNSVDRLFCNQLAYELGEYYFAVDKHLAIDFLCRCLLESDESMIDHQSFCTINQPKILPLVTSLKEVKIKFNTLNKILYFQQNQDYEGVYILLFRLLLDKKKLDTHSHEELSYSLRNNLVNEAMNLQQEHSAIKIAICNALDLDEKMLDQIPLSCIQYLGNYFNEELLKDIIEIFKKLFGNYPGVNMSANKREFIIQLISKINNEDVWNYICKTEGFEFIQYSIENNLEEFSSLFVPYSHNIDSMEIIEVLDNQQKDDWTEIDHLIKDDINNSHENINNLDNLDTIKTSCNNILNRIGIMNIQVLESIALIMIESHCWDFLETFLSNLNTRRKNINNGKYEQIFLFCDIMIPCVQILKFFSKYTKDIICVENHSVKLQKHFDIIFDMSFQEIRNIRAAFYNFVKALTFRGNDYKLVLDFFVRIKKVVWIHQIFRSLMAGYLCETQRQKKYKKLNTQLYGPFTILMMSTSCATEIWPDRGLHQLRKVLNEKIKRIRYDITEILIDWCKLSAKNDNQPTYQTDLILSNIYYLQGSPLKSLSLDAIASMTFFFTRLEKIEESLVSFEQIIRCCISRKVFHQFNRDEITYIETSYLLDISLSNGSLKTSQFANYLWETQLLKYICSDATSCNEVVKWLKSILFEESPEMFPDSFVREAYKRYLFRPRIKLIGLDIDPKHLTKRIESIKQDFLVVLNDWISKDYEHLLLGFIGLT